MWAGLEKKAKNEDIACLRVGIMEEFFVRLF